MTTTETETKLCPKCGEEKPLTAFYKNRAAKDGRSWSCAICTSADHKERMQKYTNRRGEGLYVHRQPLLTEEPSFDSKVKVITEIYRNYESLKDFRARTGKDVFEYAGIQFSVSELDPVESLQILAPQQRKAFFLGVLLDHKYIDVAKEMGVSNVTAQQYIKRASQKLAEYHFPARKTKTA